MWDDAKIWTELFNAPKWTIKYTDGSTKEEEPKLKFKKRRAYSSGISRSSGRVTDTDGRVFADSPV